MTDNPVARAVPVFCPVTFAQRHEQPARQGPESVANNGSHRKIAFGQRKNAHPSLHIEQAKSHADAWRWMMVAPPALRARAKLLLSRVTCGASCTRGRNPERRFAGGLFRFYEMKHAMAAPSSEKAP
jgi:hypothetical protein